MKRLLVTNVAAHPDLGRLTDERGQSMEVLLMRVTGRETGKELEAIDLMFPLPSLETLVATLSRTVALMKHRPTAPGSGQEH